MISFLKSKHKGNLGDILGTGMCIVIMLMLLTVSIQYMQVLTIKRNVEQVSRQALLMLETSGELKTADKTALGNQLRDMGFTNYTITFNTNNTKKAYGETVSVVITARGTPANLGLVKAVGIIKDNYEFKTTLYSIAKYYYPET